MNADRMEAIHRLDDEMSLAHGAEHAVDVRFHHSPRG